MTYEMARKVVAGDTVFEKGSGLPMRVLFVEHSQDAMQNKPDEMCKDVFFLCDCAGKPVKYHHTGVI